MKTYTTVKQIQEIAKRFEKMFEFIKSCLIFFPIRLRKSWVSVLILGKVVSVHAQLYLKLPWYLNFLRKAGVEVAIPCNMFVNLVRLIEFIQYLVSFG